MAAVALVLVVAAAVFFFPGPAAAAAPAPQCAPVLLVGLRGNGDTLDNDGGMGADALAVVERIRDRLSPAGFDMTTIAWPYATGPWWRIGGHVRTASAALASYLSARHRRCPSERLALIGQSEGAAVVHVALPEVGPQLAVALLMADPLRVVTGVPPSLRSAVGSYCLREDPVCDPSPVALSRRLRGDSVHTTYRLNPNGIADRAAEFAASRLTAAGG